MISYKNMSFRFGCFLFDLKSFCHFSRLHSSLCALKNEQKHLQNMNKLYHLIFLSLLRH